MAGSIIWQALAHAYCHKCRTCRVARASALCFLFFYTVDWQNTCSGASMKCACLSGLAATVLILAAAGCPSGTQAQQQQLPVVGYLSFTSPDERPTLVAAFRQGLQQAGFVVGQNVAIEYRSAGGKYERLPGLAAELVKIPAAVIAATGGEVVARAAKTASAQIPIVFTSGSDAVKGGLVASLNRPGGNVTGVSLLGYELDSKRLQLLRELLPRASTIGVLANATNPAVTAILPQMKVAAEANGQRLVVLDARTEVDIDAAFGS